MSTDVKRRGLTSKKRKTPENRHIQATKKKRLEIDTAAVGSVSGETVDRLASVEDETSTVHATHVGESKEPENATPTLTRSEKKLYNIYKILEDCVKVKLTSLVEKIMMILIQYLRWKKTWLVTESLM